MNDKNLKGGVAVITGAASGIGEALSRHAVQELGMKVVLADISEEGLDRVAGELRAMGGDVLPMVTDVTDPTALEHLAEQTASHYGNVKLLVNNAGIELLGFSWEIPADEWEKILRVNIHGVVHGVRAFLPGMIASGEHCIVANLASVAGVSIAPLQTSYVMSKHAVLAFSECLHIEVAMKKANVQVSAVLPGPVNTGIFKAVQKATDPIVDRHREQMARMLEEDGMSAQDAARTIFRQLQDGEFWVSTQPEFTEFLARQRADNLSSLKTPGIEFEGVFDLD